MTHVDPDDRSFRRSLLRAAGGGLLALVVTSGVTAVLTVIGRDTATGPAVIDGQTAAPPTAATSPATAAPEDPPPSPSPEVTDDSDQSDDEVAGVTVQVLDAAGTGTHAEDAAEVLRDLGYEVVVVNETPRRVEVTRILATPGAEDAAEALRQRDDRFVEVGVNNDFNPEVDLHILVGPDFSD